MRDLNQETRMKLFIAAALATIAVPVLAQTPGQTQGSSSTADPSAGSSGQNAQSSQNGQPMGSSSGATTSGGGQTAPTDPSAGGASSTTGGSAAGGASATGTPAGGQRPVFQPAASPEQAFPPPPALDHYPPCKAGQTDKCMETGRSGHAKARHHRK
jgi:hypothetical protein